MSDRPKFFDDLAGVAGGALSAFAGLREEMTAAVKARVDEAVRKMDLIKRDEFEAMAELARRARTQADALELRVAALEAAGHAPSTPAPRDSAPLESAPPEVSLAPEPPTPPPATEGDVQPPPDTQT
jgi:BMFP domain-containing protein YqiC